jgi:hypothetical protein
MFHVGYYSSNNLKMSSAVDSLPSSQISVETFTFPVLSFGSSPKNSADVSHYNDRTLALQLSTRVENFLYAIVP